MAKSGSAPSSLVDPVALVGVAQELLDPLGQWVVDRRALALDDDQRDAVHEQDDVGDDEPPGHRRGTGGRAGTRCFSGWSKSMKRTVRPRSPVRPLDADAFQQQGGGLLVDLHQLAGGEPQQAVDGRLDAGLVEPLLAVVVEVDPPQRRRQPLGQDHLAEAGPLGEVGHLRVAVESGPAECFERLHQRGFDQGELVAGVHGLLLDVTREPGPSAGRASGPASGA